MVHYSNLSTPLKVNGLTLKNRITMTPLYLGYANPDGTVSPLLLDYYREMAASGVAMVVVENSAVQASGLGSPFTLRSDHDRYLRGLRKLAETIKREGALALLQINHAGRYRFMPKMVAPSPIKTGDNTPEEMTTDQINKTIASFAAAANRTKKAGFDGVEIHGGTSYLIIQFLSPKTNHRTDKYGGILENRARFGLEVLEAVKLAVGEEFPVGYRFNADEWLHDGLHVEETGYVAKELEKRGVTYLSVMAGSYEAINLPEYLEQEKKESYMAKFAGEIRKVLKHTPVIAAGRINSPKAAESLLANGTADLIGLARVLLADPLWPKKALGESDIPIVQCQSSCSLCLKKVMKGEPVFCSQWPEDRRANFEKATQTIGFKTRRILCYLRQKYIIKDW